MTESGAKPRRRRIWRYLLWLAVSGVLLISALRVVHDHELFPGLGAKTNRRRAGTHHRRASSGRKLSHHSVCSFRSKCATLRFMVAKSPSDVPYAHVDSLVAQVKVVSLLSRRIRDSVDCAGASDHSLIIYPDGTTNQPEPTMKQSSGGSPVQQVFSLSINHLQVRRGELIWNDAKIPLDFTSTICLQTQLFAVTSALHCQSSGRQGRHQAEEFSSRRVDRRRPTLRRPEPHREADCSRPLPDVRTLK